MGTTPSIDARACSTRLEPELPPLDRSTDALLSRLAVIDLEGWSGPVGTELLEFIRTNMVRPLVVGVGLRGVLASQAEATAWEEAWAALDQPSLRCAAQPWGVVWATARRAALGEGLRDPHRHQSRGDHERAERQLGVASTPSGEEECAGHTPREDKSADGGESERRPPEPPADEADDSGQLHITEAELVWPRQGESEVGGAQEERCQHCTSEGCELPRRQRGRHEEPRDEAAGGEDEPVRQSVGAKVDHAERRAADRERGNAGDL